MKHTNSRKKIRKNKVTINQIAQISFLLVIEEIKPTNKNIHNILNLANEKTIF